MEKIKISITLNREAGGGGSGGGTCFTATATPADKVVTISHPLPDETTREEAHEASNSCSASVDATVTYQQRQQAPTHATTTNHNNNNKEEEEEVMQNERLQKLQQTTEKQEAEIQRLFSQLQRHKEREEAQTELCRSLQERVGRLEAMLEHLLASSPSFSSSCSASLSASSSSEERHENEDERSEEDRKVREEEKENCDTSKREKVVEEEKEQLEDDEKYNSVTQQADEDNEGTEDEKRQREDEKCGNITRSEGSREADEENEEAEEVKEEERTSQIEKNTEEQGKEKEKKRRNSDSSQQQSSSFTKLKHLHTKELNAMKEKEKGKSRSSRAASSSSSAPISSRTRSSSASGSSSPASFAASRLASSTNSGSLTPTSLVDSSSFAPKKHAYLKRKKDILGPRPKRYPGFGYKSSGLQIAGKRVALTGFTDASQRAQLAADIVKLRGVVIEDPEFDPQTTHVVAATGCARSLKTMGATLKGKWIVSPQWITASNAAGEFVDESHYGSRYTGPSPFKNKCFYIAYSFSQSSSPSRIRVASLLIDYGGGTLLNNLKKQIDFTLVGGEGEEDQQDEVPSGVALTWSQFVHMIPDPTPASSSPSYKESSEGSISPTKPSNGGLDSPLLSRAATSPMLARTRTKSSSFTSPSSSPLSSSSPLNSTKATKIINNDSEENQPSQTSVQKEEKANSLNMTIRTPEQRRRAIEEAEKGLTGSELQWSL
ncbi:hypothetical protein QOT17_016377 [Balamuthia mandrillaris]